MSLRGFPCPFCGRESERPGPMHRFQSHRVERSPAASFYVRCWYCAACGPLSESPSQAIERFGYSAARSGVPKW